MEVVVAVDVVLDDVDEEVASIEDVVDDVVLELTVVITVVLDDVDEVLV